ncbi:nuclear transport factor 2 family protein [Maricaulis sp.]|jgi:uncharacterized protein (TIGR02246 family)|uniref:nuclear transport factor 2 family protein n=1 Tax=Maricaulis sp. TaxID=1486257 RepID=UPI0025CDE018|nr:nuclear transport factor 2 family protein [Maricaulis sp.]MDF1768527.1 nuclear transport factor 2 family protein [Maricaulis sp.]
MRNTLSLIALAIALPMFATESQAQERREIPAYREIGIEAGSEQRQALLDFLRDFREAWSEEDTEAFIALHTDDSEWINAYARMFTDAPSLADFLENRLFPAFGPGVSRTEAENMELISMRALGDDAAVLHLYTDGNRGPSAVEGRALRRTHFHLVLVQQSGQWKVAHTAIMDARD